MKLFVAKLNRDVQDEHLVEAFSAFGEVAYARVITDRDTGQSKCFGFVQMREESAGRAAIEAMNGAELMGFRMVVKEAEERPRAQGAQVGAAVLPRVPGDDPGVDAGARAGGGDAGVHAARRRAPVRHLAAPRRLRPQRPAALPDRPVGVVLCLEGLGDWQAHGQREDLPGEAEAGRPRRKREMCFSTIGFMYNEYP